MTEGRFVAVYHEDLIANFPDVWNDDRQLATWLRLFALADKLWPSPAEMPRSASQTAVKKLVKAGLVELAPNERYRIRGLDARRIASKEAASIAASKRWSNAPSNADGNAERIPDSNPHAGAQSGSPSGNGVLSSSAGVRSGEGVAHLVALQDVTLLPIERIEARTRREFDRLADQRGSDAVALAIREVADRIPTQPPAARQLMVEVLRVMEPFSPPSKANTAKGLNPSAQEVANAFRS